MWRGCHGAQSSPWDAGLRRVCHQHGLGGDTAGACALGAHGGPLSRRALGISVTDYTFEDCQLALAEGQLRLPADTSLLEFARLVRGLG